jgi:hypothetical protein
MTPARIAIGALAFGAAWLLAVPGSRADFTDIAVLQGLDKVTARVSRIEVPVGSTVTFGALEISADACYKRPPEETPESAAFLRIAETRPGETPQTIFSGWMFASSPALSALENAVYDVWVIDCISATTDASGNSTGN